MRTRIRSGGFGAPLMLAAALAPAVLVAAPASAQDGFMFGRPVATFSLMGGWSRPGEGSDLFEYTREHLTVGEGAFAAPLFSVEASWRATERLDVALGLEHASRTVGSEMRDWVTQNDRPIPQSTRFSRTRLMASVKGYLLRRGREISSYAWVPGRWSPYVGGGAGYAGFEFVQEGDFVDAETFEIFEDQLAAGGGGLTAHALAGLQVSLSPRLVLKGEYRYIWGDGSIRPNEYGPSEFDGFGDVDLSGSRAIVGLALRMPPRRR